MIGRITLLCSLSLFLPVYSPKGFSQTNLDKLHLSISLEKTTLDPHKKIKVRVTVENQTGRTIKTGSIPVLFRLSKLDKPSANCTLSDCFEAATYWAKEFKDGKKYVTEVQLTDLYWEDVVLCGTDLHRSKNMSKAILPNEYNLLLEFHFSDKTREDDPRVIIIKSNAILVKVEGKKSF